MGSYTTLARFARSAARSTVGARARHGRSTLENDAEQAAQAQPYSHICPECGDGATVAADCPRCDVPMRSTSRAATFPKADGVTTVRAPTSLTTAALALAATFFVPALFVFVSTSLDNSYGPQNVAVFAAWMKLAALATALGVFPLALAKWSPRVRSRLRWRRILNAARGRLGALTARVASEAPVQAEQPVRVRGHVQVSDGQVHVGDERDRVRVPLDVRVRVIDEGQEAHHLEHGQEVEVVGVGARELGAGDGYRDTRGIFVFDANQPLEVWIR